MKSPCKECGLRRYPRTCSVFCTYEFIHVNDIWSESDPCGFGELCHRRHQGCIIGQLVIITITKPKDFGYISNGIRTTSKYYRKGYVTKDDRESGFISVDFISYINASDLSNSGIKLDSFGYCVPIERFKKFISRRHTRYYE